MAMKMAMNSVPSPDSIFQSFTASNWLKKALAELLDRDIVDAARDAELLAKVVRARCNYILRIPIGMEKSEGQINEFDLDTDRR